VADLTGKARKRERGREGLGKNNGTSQKRDARAVRERGMRRNKRRGLGDE